MKKIITIGEAMGLFVADEVGSLVDINHYTRFTAGAEMNVSIGLARLGFEVYYSTQFGKDPIGEFIKKSMEKEKIHTDFIYFTDESFTGLMIKEKVLSGDPYVASFRKGSAATRFTKEKIKDIDFKMFDHIHLAGIFMALSEETREVSHYFADQSKKHNIHLTFDPNLRPGLWKNQDMMIDEINKIAFKCEYVLPGIEEGKILTRGLETPEAIADFYLNKGVSSIFIKLGAKGAYVQSQSSKGIVVPGYKVDEVVDTVGAGDGFAVGVISALSEGLDLEAAAQRGNAVGALQVMCPGDNDGLPDRKKLETFMNL